MAFNPLSPTSLLGYANKKMLQKTSPVFNKPELPQIAPLNQRMSAIPQSTLQPAQQRMSVAPQAPTPQPTPQVQSPQTPQTPQFNPQQQLNSIRDQALAIQSQLRDRTASQTPEIAQGGDFQPQTPQVSPEAQRTLENAEKAYQQSLQLSPEELSTQADLDRLIESTKKAYTGTQDKAIPLEFITGQLASIENRAMNLAEPLEAKLARLQAKRQASQQASKFALERAQEKVDEQTEGPESTATFTNQKGETILYNAKTGETIANLGLSPSEGAETQVVEAGGKKILINTQTGETIRELGPTEGALTRASKATEDALGASGLKQTTINKIRGNISKADTVIENINDAIGMLNKNSLLNPVIGTAIGRGTVGRFLPGESAELRGAINTVKANIGFDRLQAMREESPTGGALGQVSEREIAFLQSVAGSLDQSQGADKLIENLNEIKQSFKTLKALSIAEAGGQVSITATDPASGETVGPVPANKQEIEELIINGYDVQF